MRSVPRPDVAVRFVLVMVMALMACESAARADEIHVPADFPTIQAAIDAAIDGDEVVVADGVYTGDGNRNITYLGKAITVRSENGPDNCIVDLQGLANRGFLFVDGESRDAVLDGFTIRNASLEAEAELDSLRGGAILIEYASPSISNCIFLTNVLVSEKSSSFGGAIFSRGNPTLSQCSFDTNVAFGGVSAEGGAFYNDGGNPTFVDCTFDDNLSFSQLASGGAIGGAGSITVFQCTFFDNHVDTSAPGRGGAVNVDNAMMINCHFEANGGPVAGGAVAVDSGLLINCVFAANVADDGGGFSGSAAIHNCTFTQNESSHGAAIDGDAVVTNTIAWNNIGDDPINGAAATYSNIQGGWPGEGNIDADPLFVDPDNGDYRLSPGSPCIDAADNNAVVCALSDRDGNERFTDDPRTRDTGLGRPPIIDMGAYEFGSPRAVGGDDCNQNGLDDACELAGGLTPDCNGNGVPDHCDIADGSSSDCDGNGILDECERFDDCNGNGVPDACDIAGGASADCNDNGIPDDCEEADCNIHVPGDFPTIQRAINAAVDGNEVVIADGVYSGAGNRELNFDGKAITVRSENGPDNCIVDLGGENRGFLFFNGETNASVVDGLTLRNAFHQTFQPKVLRGGAIFIEDASPTISNCIFADNDLDSNGFQSFGGAIYSSGDPILTNCVFDTNSIFGGLLAGGGAFYNDGGDPQFFDCHFQNNSSIAWPAGGAAFGGAIGGEGSVTLTRCTFVDNDVLGDQGNSTGGAVATDKAMLIDCHFEGNRVTSHGPAQGGALAVTDESSQVINCSFFNNDAISCCAPPEGGAMSGPGTLLNCLFVGNVADNGGGYAGAGSVLNCTFVANEAGIGAAIDGDAVVSNTIAWDNIGDPINGAEVTYSNIQGGYDGEGNISGTPRFVDQANGDYRLAAGSPSIDAGDNTALPSDQFDLDEDGDTDEPIPIDLDGNPRFVDDPDTRDTGLGDPPIVDMGAYEFQGVACPWDLDGDGLVGTGDLIVMLGSWGDPYGTADLIELLGSWGVCP